MCKKDADWGRIRKSGGECERQAKEMGPQREKKKKSPWKEMDLLSKENT